jgi:hypothetical protein
MPRAFGCSAKRSNPREKIWLPFASPHGLFQLSRLSVWRLRLGIAIETFDPAMPSRTAAMSRCT